MEELIYIEKQGNKKYIFSVRNTLKITPTKGKLTFEK
jgi:hypothetical protein